MSRNISGSGKTCLFPGCDRQATFRGVCWGCFQCCCRAVRKKKETTWDELIALGWIEPEADKPRDENRIIKELSRAREKTGYKPPVEHDDEDITIADLAQMVREIQRRLDEP